jgi:hypothetical protein
MHARYRLQLSVPRRRTCSPLTAVGFFDNYFGCFLAIIISVDRARLPEDFCNTIQQRDMVKYDRVIRSHSAVMETARII